MLCRPILICPTVVTVNNPILNCSHLSKYTVLFGRGYNAEHDVIRHTVASRILDVPEVSLSFTPRITRRFTEAGS